MSVFFVIIFIGSYVTFHAYEEYYGGKTPLLTLNQLNSVSVLAMYIIAIPPSDMRGSRQFLMMLRSTLSQASNRS